MLALRCGVAFRASEYLLAPPWRRESEDKRLSYICMAPTISCQIPFITQDLRRATPRCRPGNNSKGCFLSCINSRVLHISELAVKFLPRYNTMHAQDRYPKMMIVISV